MIDLDRVVAYVSDSPLNIKNADGIKADPPKIFWAPAPALLVNIDGEPAWSPIEGLDLRYAVNTNWDLFEHTASKLFYLRDEVSWLQAPAVSGPWTAVAGALPASFSKLPIDDNWKEVKAALPGKKLTGAAIPKVFVSMEPAELIELEGAARYQKVAGSTTLLWVDNTEADLFRMGQTGDFYFLVAGRWFKAAALDGPWTFASTSLPADFKQISVEHPRSRVLASVPVRRRRQKPSCLRRFPEPPASTKKN